METGRTPLQRYYHQEDYTCGGDSSEIKIQRRFLGELGHLYKALRKNTHAECIKTELPRITYATIWKKLAVRTIRRNR